MSAVKNNVKSFAKLKALSARYALLKKRRGGASETALP